MVSWPTMRTAAPRLSRRNSSTNFSIAAEIMARGHSDLRFLWRPPISADLVRASTIIFNVAMSAHGSPSGDCLVCYEEVTAENYVEFRVRQDAPWQPAKFCQDCTQMLLDSKFEAYISGVEKSTCEAELRRYMIKGPPVFIEDPTGFPVGDGLR